jgi:hypothetical protein
LLNADQPLGRRRFPRKSSRVNHFFDRPIWLPLALEGPFWELAGTISGTVRASRTPSFAPPDAADHLACESTFLGVWDDFRERGFESVPLSHFGKFLHATFSGRRPCLAQRRRSDARQPARLRRRVSRSNAISPTSLSPIIVVSRRQPRRAVPALVAGVAASTPDCERGIDPVIALRSEY